MAACLLSAVLSAQFALCAGIFRTRALDNFNESSPYRQSMRNTGDAQYTGVMKVGGQELNAVFDTGSFELVVLGNKCTSCGLQSDLFNDQISSSYKGSTFKAEHSYGSGTTNSIEASDAVAIGHLSTQKQTFWEVIEANMPILSAGTFQAILGIGPPTSAIKFAQEDVNDVQKELTEYLSKGNTVTESIQNTVKHYKDLLVHAKKATSVVQNLAVDTMSVCLGKESGSEGYMVWNDNSHKDYPDRFVTVDVVGDYYWSADMKNIRLGSTSFASGKAFEGKNLGCVTEKCSAVIDSGTTLIVAPESVVAAVDNAIDAFVDAGGTCDDLSKLPELEFQLGGKAFSLPPEAYIGKVSGSFSAATARYVPHVLQRRHQARRWGDCESLLMSMEMDTQQGTTWILGMAFFRKYYSSFHFASKHGEYQAQQMSFAVADSQCEPESAKDVGSEVMIADRLARKRARLNVDASKIRLPNLVSRVEKANAKAGQFDIGRPFVRI